VPHTPDPAPTSPGGCRGDLEREAAGQVLTATCWLDPGDSGPAGPVTVRFSGRRAGITGTPGRGDRFEREETVEGVLPGSGPVSVTARMNDVTAGEWLVRARVVARPGPRRQVHQLSLPDGGSQARVLRRVLWPKGNPVAAEGPGTTARTRLGAFAAGPGIVAGSWSAAVTAGVGLALWLLTVLLGRVHVGAGRALAVSAAVVLAGIIGARAWYVMLQRGKTEGLAVRGLCIQGTVAGGALAAVPALLIAGIPVGTFFDAATPGLFFAMAVGRQGCFLTGCCGGRPTASRFGIWSSDGRVGARRLPTQQLEALACLLIGAAALAAFWHVGRAAGGAVFAGAMAVYILARQGLLALRTEPRRWSLAGPVTLAAAAGVLLADIAVAALR
jgi:phosphatidylglycerol:prolipoprotein diacylglycerol transferase